MTSQLESSPVFNSLENTRTTGKEVSALLKGYLLVHNYEAQYPQYLLIYIKIYLVSGAQKEQGPVCRLAQGLCRGQQQASWRLLSMSQ